MTQDIKNLNFKKNPRKGSTPVYKDAAPPKKVKIPQGSAQKKKQSGWESMNQPQGGFAAKVKTQ